MSCCQAANSFGNCVFAPMYTSRVLPAPFVPPPEPPESPPPPPQAARPTVTVVAASTARAERTVVDRICFSLGLVRRGCGPPHVLRLSPRVASATRRRPAVAGCCHRSRCNRWQPLVRAARASQPRAMATLTVHPDRLLPPAPEPRTVARRLYAAVRDLPIVSPHGHVDPRILVDDEAFADPASLFIQPDHYVTRLLHAGGVALDRLGVGEGPLPEDRAREAWRLLCENWHLLRGTPVRYWFDSELSDIFGVPERRGAETADSLYDQIAEQLASPDHRPRPPLFRFRPLVM